MAKSQDTAGPKLPTQDQASKADEQLASIAAKLKAGELVPPSTPRTILTWFDSSRRGRKRVVRVIDALSSYGLRTSPPLTETYIDGSLTFELVSGVQPIDTRASEGPGGKGKHERSGENVGSSPEKSDAERDRIAGYAVRRLRSANTSLISVKPTDTLKTVVTVMLTHDVSQVPVMQSEFDLKGVIRWSSLGARLALGRIPKLAKDCMEPPIQIRAADDIFAVVDQITQNEYALVQEENKHYTGIVTISDLSEILHIWAEPFLLLGEIENRVRSIIRPRFAPEELKKLAKDDSELIETTEDLTFGHYVRLLQNPANWDRLDIPLERAEFIRHMERVRDIRNDVMHFDPDRSEDDAGDTAELKSFLKLLQQLRSMDLC